MTLRKRFTEKQISDLNNLFIKLPSIDNKKFCRYLLKTYGIRTATEYAKVILSPAHTYIRQPGLHLKPYPGKL